MTTWCGATEDPQFAQDCQNLGFEMDCGKSLEAAYPGIDIFRAECLQKIIHTINDSDLLDPAIFSYWRYLTHWHNAPLPDDAVKWFETAFDRLSELNEPAIKPS
jgi:hypothetical protein